MENNGHHFQRIATYYDALNSVLSLGLHRGWERRLVHGLQRWGLRPGAEVVDVATGTGTVGRRIQNTLAPAEVWGVDPSRRMMAVGRRQGRRLRYRQGTSEALPLPSHAFDALTCAYGVRNFSDRSRAFSEWGRVLRPGAVVGVLEIHPLPPTWWALPSRLYWRLIPWVGRALGAGSAYRHLYHSANGFLRAEEMVHELGKEGFQLLQSQSLLPGGMVTLQFFKKAGHEPVEHDR